MVFCSWLMLLTIITFIFIFLMITAITDNLFTWYSGHIEWNVHILLNGMLELNMNSSPCIDLLGQ